MMTSNQVGQSINLLAIVPSSMTGNHDLGRF
jgi:hypothetical protein